MINCIDISNYREHCIRKPIPSFPGYEADDEGNIWSNYPDRWHSKTNKKMTPTPQENGYLKLSLQQNSKSKMVWLHRLVCEAFHGVQPGPGYQARHLDGNTAHNTPDNLAWGTALDNLNDARRHGTAVKGERVGGAKLTADDVVEIIRLYYTGLTYQNIASRFDVCFTCIEGILCGRTWKHITGGRLSLGLKGVEHATSHIS